MRVKDNGNAVLIWASADDTRQWSNRSGAAWPCFELSGHRFFAAFDTNGLYDLTVDGKDAPEDLRSNELSAICADLIGEKIGADHPCHFVVVGQFKESSAS